MVRVILLTPAWRLVTALLVATSLATLPTYALAIVLLPPVPPIVMARSFALGTILPAAIAWAVGRAFAATVELRDGSLHLRRADLAGLADGRHVIDGERVYVLLQRYATKPFAGGRLEIHRSGIGGEPSG